MINHRGYTLLEMIVTVAITGIILLVAVQGFPHIEKFMASSRLRQKANTEARVSMDTINRLLRNAKASTMIITSPALSLPLSRANFVGTDGYSYEIGVDATPTDWNAYFSFTPPGKPTNKKITAENVTTFAFSRDPDDPTGIKFQYVSETALDTSGKAESIYRVEVPAEIRMEGN